MRQEGLTGVVVVNFGSHELVRDNLKALPIADGSIIVVIVDNFTTQMEAQAVTALCDQRGWIAALLSSNTGFGAAVNRGVETALERGCTSFLVLNPDATIDGESLELLRRRCREHPMVMQSPRVIRPDGSLWFGGGTVSVERGTALTRPGSDSSAPGGWLSGACLMFSHRAWAASGGFDERYFLYWEDIDFSYRCVAGGVRLVVTEEAVAVHSVGGTQPGRGKSPAYVYFNCRNRLVFASLHLNARDVRHWLASSGRYSRQILLRGGRRALLRHPVRLLSAAAGGTVAGAFRALPMAFPRRRGSGSTGR